MAEEHDGGGADEGGMDGSIEALAAVEGVTAGETGGNLAGGGPEEDVVEVSNGLRWAQAAEGGEAEGVVSIPRCD